MIERTPAQQSELDARIADDEKHAENHREAREYDALLARAEALRAENERLDEEETQLLRIKSAHEMEIEFMQQQLDALRARVALLEELLNKERAETANCRSVSAQAIEYYERRVAELERADIQVSRRGLWKRVKPGDWRPAPSQE